MITLKSPAKINLTLEVLGKREDGFHEIRSIVQATSLCDTLSFKDSQQVEITSSSPGWQASESLIYRAVKLIQEYTGYSRGVEITVDKRIPLMAGLGGDSSNAATTLLGLNRLWGLGLSVAELNRLSAKLGSDVSFFLYGGTALLEGRGEVVTPLPSLPHQWVLLIVPEVPRLPGKTRRLYESLHKGYYTDGGITSRLVVELKAGKGFDTSLLFNTFENVAFTLFPAVDITRRHIVKIGARNIHLAGSGPALFTLLDDRAEAEDLLARLRNQNPEIYLVETL